MKISSHPTQLVTVLSACYLFFTVSAAHGMSQCGKPAKDPLVKKAEAISDKLKTDNDIESAEASKTSGTGIDDGSNVLQRTSGNQTVRANEAAAECHKILPECDKIKCMPESQRPSTQKSCRSEVTKICKGIEGAGKQTASAKEDAGKTGDASKADPNQQSQQQQPQPPPQQPQPSNNDQQKAQEETSKMPGAENQTSKGEADCSNGNFAMSPECLKKKIEQDKCTADSSNNSDQCRTLRAQSFCSEGGRGMCPSCRNMTAQTFSTMSANDLQAVCNGSCAPDPNFGPNLADRCRSVIGGRNQAQAGSLGIASTAASGVSGGGRSASSGGSTSQARLDREIRIPDGVEGSKEGQSNAPDASGGFSGYGGASGGGSLFGSDGDSGPSRRGANGGGVAARSVASAGAKDVATQNSMNVFRIFSEVIRTRCQNGRLLHCGPYK